MRIGRAEFCLLFVLASGLALSANAAEKRQDYAVVAGTVFREPGFALPGAEVRLKVKTTPEGVKPPKPQKAISDSRGEFAFHVPAGTAEYTVSVRAAGFVAEEKTANVTADERVDVYFELRAVK
ncbi:MAG: carboxypeptidase regulatory-like domain-containing protein [Bryobacteraceae bacterium]|jgi:hypothetical protein